MQKIYNGKLYDTEKAKLIASSGHSRVYQTPHGRWFKVIVANQMQQDGYLTPITADQAAESVARYAPERFAELFGACEEA